MRTGPPYRLIEHVMRAVANLCQKVVVMHHGEKITEGTPEMVMNDPMSSRIYLGKGGALIWQTGILR